MQKLSVLARINPISVNDKDEVDSALASALAWLVDALDNDKTIAHIVTGRLSAGV